MHIFLLLSMLLQQATLPAGQGPSSMGVVDGVLRDDAGKPAAGVRVSAMAPPKDGKVSAGTAMAAVARTDSAGHYRLEGVAPGQYLISAGRLEFPSFYPGTLDVAGGKVVSVASGGTVTGINFAMEPMSEGRSYPAAVSVSGRTPTSLNARGGQRGPNNPPEISLYVSIQMEDGGKVPVFGNARFPKLKLTSVSTGTPYESWFGGAVINVPRPESLRSEEYKVAVEDLPDGYTVKSITCRADEPGVRFVDVLNQTFKLSTRAIGASYATGITLGIPEFPIAITLTRVPATAPPGIRVTGTSAGLVFGRPLPKVGGNVSPLVNDTLDVGVYLSGKPGVLYDDGTFEFSGVSPGTHSIILFSLKQSEGARVLTTEVTVRDRDVEGVNLRVVPPKP